MKIIIIIIIMKKKLYCRTDGLLPRLYCEEKKNLYCNMSRVLQ